MATQQEIIQILLQSDGVDDARQIVTALQGIATSGDTAAPAAQRVLEAFEAIGTQTNAAASIASLRAELAETADSMVAARLKVEQFEAQFDAAEAPTARLTANLAKARAGVAALQAQFNSQQAAITSAENALASAGLSTENLDATQRELAAQLAVTRAEALELAAGFDTATAAGEREALTMTEVADRSSILRAGFDQLKTVLGTIAGILAFEKIKQDIGEVLDTGDKFAKWGAEFAAAFGSAQAGEDALAKVKQIADETPLSLDQVTQAALQAKKEGLDPFDGSLQSIISTSVQYGGNADTVTELITALGKSANQGGLNIRTLTLLQQQGIPAAQLLGNAMGKTSDQIIELAKNSKLGSDSVSTLISALGKQNTGALASQMQLLGTQVVKVKDDYDEFLELIAKSGAYDFVVGKLNDLNVAFKQGLEDGSLQASAKAISDDLIALGNALISVTKFAIDHGDAIKTVAEAYALFKVSKLAADLLLMAGNLATNTAATLRNAAAAQADAAAQVELAAAMKAASVAAGGSNVALDAASKGGILNALKSFSSLRGALNGVGSSLTGLVGGPIPAFIAAVGFAAVETYNAIDAEIAWGKQSLELIDQQRELAQTQTDLVAKAKVVAEQTKASADTQIATADALAGKNKEQSASYIASLQNAVRYYTSIEVQDKALGDSQGAKAANDKIKAYSLAIIDATTHQKELGASIEETSAKVAAVVDHFDALESDAKSAITAITGAFDGIQIDTPSGLQKTVDIITQISIQSKDAKNAVEGELVGALQKLDAADLSDIQKNLLDLFANGKVSAQTLKTFLDASLQASLTGLGLSAEQSGQEFTSAGAKIIASFTNIADNARSSGNQIQLAFAQSLSKLTTSGEVETLKAQLQDAFNEGRISAAQLAAGTDAAGRKIADLQATAKESGDALDGMGKVGQSAFDALGIKSQATLERLAADALRTFQQIKAGSADTGAGLVDQQNAFLAYAAKALAASVQLDQGQRDAIEANLESQAAILKVTGALQTLETQSNKSAAAVVSDSQKYEASLTALGDAAVARAKAYEEAGNAANYATDQTKAAGDAAADAAKKYDGFTDTGEEGFADLTQAMANTRTEFLKISDAAAAFYDESLKGNFELTTESDDAGAGFQRTAEAMAAAAKQTTDQIADQRSQLQAEITDINNVGTSSASGFGQFGTSADAAAAKMKSLVADIQNGTYDAGLLGQADLAPLQQALQEAIQRTQQLADAAQQAKDQFSSLGDQLQDDLDSAAGNDTAVEDRRFQKQLADLKAAAQAAGELNSAQYRQDVQNANDLHALKLKQIQEQQDAQNGTTSSGGGSSPSSPGGIGSGSSGSNGGGAGLGGLQQVNIHINGQPQDATILTDDAGTQLLKSLILAKGNSI